MVLQSNKEYEFSARKKSLTNIYYYKDTNQALWKKSCYVAISLGNLIDGKVEGVLLGNWYLKKSSCRMIFLKMDKSIVQLKKVTCKSTVAEWHSEELEVGCWAGAQSGWVWWKRKKMLPQWWLCSLLKQITITVIESHYCGWLSSQDKNAIRIAKRERNRQILEHVDFVLQSIRDAKWTRLVP